MRGIASKLKPLLKSEDREERCGLVLKRGKIVEIDNTHPYPDQGFMISAQVMHENKDNLTGTWHTHPGGSAALSHDDYQGFYNWPGIPHYIIGVDGVRAYVSDEEGVIEEVPCT